MVNIVHCSDFQTLGILLMGQRFKAEELPGQRLETEVGGVRGVGMGADMCSTLCIFGVGAEAERRASSPSLLPTPGSGGAGNR